MFEEKKGRYALVDSDEADDETIEASFSSSSFSSSSSSSCCSDPGVPPCPSASYHSHRCSYSHLEEARGLTWTDPFYEGKPGIVAVFDLEKHRTGRYLLVSFLAVAVVWGILGGVFLGLAYWNHGDDQALLGFEEGVGGYMCAAAVVFGFLAFRARRAVWEQHLCVTDEGVRFDHGDYLQVTVPFERILSVDTSGGGVVRLRRPAAPLERWCGSTHTTELHGVRNAPGFVRLVRAIAGHLEHGSYRSPVSTKLELPPIPDAP